MLDQNLEEFFTIMEGAATTRACFPNKLCGGDMGRMPNKITVQITCKDQRVASRDLINGGRECVPERSAQLPCLPGAVVNMLISN